MCVDFNAVGEIAGTERIRGKKWRRWEDEVGCAWGLDGQGLNTGGAGK